jgi:hypothetical protein
MGIMNIGDTVEDGAEMFFSQRGIFGISLSCTQRYTSTGVLGSKFTNIFYG